MRWINNLPVWFWLLFTLVLVHITWNPTGHSLFNYVAFSEGPWSSRFLVGVVLLAIYALYLHETYQTFNMIGALLFVLIIGGTIWKAVDWGLVNATSTNLWQWISPTIFGLLLTLGLQGGRIYRGLTGRIPVSVDHAGHQQDAPVHHH